MTLPLSGCSLVSPDFRPACAYLLTQQLPPPETFLLVEDADVGPILTHPNDEEIGRWLRVSRTWGPGEGRFLRTRLQSGMRVIDIGANIGYFTLLSARAVGPAGRVLAVEADPETFLHLRANIAWNNLDNVEVLPVAAHRQAGLVEVSRNPHNYGGHTAYRVDPTWPSSPMQAVRLDEILHPDTPVDMVKIDIEGMDHAAVQGLEATIRRCRPLLLVEYFPEKIEQFGDDPVAVLGYYRSLGLQVSVLGADALRLRDHAAMEIEALISDGLILTEEFDPRIADLTRSIGLINLVLTPSGRFTAASSG